MSELHDRTVAERLEAQYRVDDGAGFRLADVDPEDTGGLVERKEGRALVKQGVRLLRDLQEQLYAQDSWSVLLIFQAMDAAGKDSAIEHVLSGVNPQGFQVSSFKAPSTEELDHDFLWRCVRRLPERGRIGVFNRSYYEEVLVVRVRPEFLAGQRIPRRLLGDRVWEERFQSIRDFERHLARNGTVIRKFFLHVSHREQRRRFLKRLDEPEKHWKFSAQDIRERRRWEGYMAAYEEMIRATATPEAPWYVIPADHKWFTRAVISAATVQTLRSLDLHYPIVTAQARTELDAARVELEAEP